MTLPWWAPGPLACRPPFLPHRKDCALSCWKRTRSGARPGASSMIRNYLGFPRGVSGGVLAHRAWEQAVLFGAGFVFTGRAARDAHGVHVAAGGVAHLVGVPLAGPGAVFGGLFGGDACALEQGAEGAAEVGGVDGGAGLGGEHVPGVLPPGARGEALGGLAGLVLLERVEGDREGPELAVGAQGLGAALPELALAVLEGFPRW